MKPLAIIPTYMAESRHFDVLQTCLETFRRTQPPKTCDLLIVDDGSPERDFVTALDRRSGELAYEVLAKEDNEGFASTVNKGLRRALEEGRDAVLVNADIEFLDDGWLEVMREHAWSKDASVVGARLLFPNGLIQHSGIFFSLLHRHFDHIYKYAPHDLPEALKPRVCPVTGALQLIRYECLTTVGLYDEDFKLGWEDVDYGIRVWRSGRKSVYNPKVRAIHHESFIRGGVTGKLAEWQNESWETFCRKHAAVSFAQFVPSLI